jgi:hypothetical protein
MSGPNVFGSEWEFTHGGVGLSSITKARGAELLGATVFERNEGRPVPPDS